MSQFVDFKALRKSLSFERVLEHYGITVKKHRGNRHVGFCPLPTHQGKKKSPSFSAKLDIGVWQCFGCKASGNVLDFAVRMEGLNPENMQDLRQVALKLQEIFGAPAPSPRPTAKAPVPVKLPAVPSAKNLPVIVKLLEFRSSLLVYNANRLSWPMEDLIVVEGFASVWWLTQHGYADCVAVMGNSCSDEQGQIMVGGLVPDGRLWILTDSDEGGERCAESIFAQVAPYRCVRWLKLPNGQPTDYTPGDLDKLFRLV